MPTNCVSTQTTAAERQTLNVTSIVLNNSNPDGIISGRVALEDRPGFDFWVDTDPGSVVESELDVPFEIRTRLRHR